MTITSVEEGAEGHWLSTLEKLGSTSNRILADNHQESYLKGLMHLFLPNYSDQLAFSKGFNYVVNSLGTHSIYLIQINCIYILCTLLGRSCDNKEIPEPFEGVHISARAVVLNLFWFTGPRKIWWTVPDSLLRKWTYAHTWIILYIILGMGSIKYSWSTFKDPCFKCHRCQT